MPLETAKTVGDAVDAGRVLLVQPWSGGEIAATGSLFQLSPQAALTYVGELAGMRVTHPVGGLQPVSMQEILLGLRVLGHAATEPEPLAEGATSSIIAAVHKDNTGSIRNIEAMALRPLSAPLPDWMQYDRIGWYGAATDADWLNYYADNETCVRCVEVLAGVGLFSQVIRAYRTNKTSGDREEFEFDLELNDLQLAAADLEAIGERRATVALVPPPLSLVFRD